MYVGISYFLGADIAKAIGAAGTKALLGVILIVAIGLGIRAGVSKWRVGRQARLAGEDSRNVKAALGTYSSRSWMPQVCVTVWPGWRTSRSSAVTKAFGGQVMGSMATAVRRRSGPSVSPVKTCSQR
jgi:hypothetical protein